MDSQQLRLPVYLGAVSVGKVKDKFPLGHHSGPISEQQVLFHQ